jgi:hypothetical protein
MTVQGTPEAPRTEPKQTREPKRFFTRRIDGWIGTIWLGAAILSIPLLKTGAPLMLQQLAATREFKKDMAQLEMTLAASSDSTRAARPLYASDSLLALRLRVAALEAQLGAARKALEPVTPRANEK